MNSGTIAIIISVCSAAISLWSAWRNWWRDYREQAEQVTAWRIPYEGTGIEEDDPFEVLKISNQSKLMVYDLIAHTVALEGTGGMRTALDEADLERGYSFGAFVGNVPPGEKTSRIRAGEVSHGSRHGISPIVNDTGYEISFIGVNPPDDNDFGDNELGAGLADGASVYVKFNGADKGCIWNIKVKWTGYAEEVFFQGLDLCKIEKATLQYDRDTKKTTALIQ